MHLLKFLKEILYSLLGIYNVKLDDEKVTFFNKFNRIDIPLTNVVNQIVFIDSFPFKKIYLKSTLGFKKIKISSEFSKNELDKLNTTITNYKHASISKEKSEVDEKFLELCEIWNNPVFLRKKILLAFISSLNSILKLDENYYWDLQADEKSKTQLESLKQLALNYTQELKLRNDEFIIHEVEKFKNLFDTIEKKPLTESQRRACVINEENNLVLAGAGSGKTSVIIGRCAYLIESQLATPDEILVIAFNNEAAKELNQRIKERLPNINLEAKTFHKTGKQIIEAATGNKIKITDFKDSMLLKKFITNEIYSELTNNFFLRMEMLDSLHPEQIELKSEFEFTHKNEYEEYVKCNNFRTLNKELVKSFGEIAIANYLFKNGINYQYERAYEISTASEEFDQYKPDFYLPDYKIYIEYYGLDKEGNTAPYINKTEYTQSIHWKRELHKEHKTIIIELFYADLKEGLLISKLEKHLDTYSVERKTEVNEKQFELINDFLKNYKISDNIISIFQVIEASNIDFNEAQIRLQQKEHNKAELSTLKLAKIMYGKYQQQLNNDEAIDFHKMIVFGIAYLNQNKFKSKWKHVLVDEFQDISDIRLEFIKALNRSTPITLFCVGDDWQSIYGFTGSKIEITTNFPNTIGDSFETQLEHTFRFNDKISSVATSFIVENPIQIKKDIETISKSNTPTIELIFVRRIDQIYEEIKNFLSSLLIHEKKQTVMILSRNNETINYFQASYSQTISSEFPRISFTYLTIHSSKGLEADFVIVLGLDGGQNGFPSIRDYDSIISKIQSTSETYPYAEERRVFYVAITRAKHNVLLISDMNNPSIFARELLNGRYEIISKQYKKICPKCSNGFLIIRTSKDNNKFLGCTNFNNNTCKYTESI